MNTTNEKEDEKLKYDKLYPFRGQFKLRTVFSVP
jgi:hypothetical protein